VDFCHVVGTLHWYKYWPLFRFLPAVSKCDSSQSNRLRLFNYKFCTCYCLPMSCLYLTSRQVTCVDGQWPVAKYTSRLNAAIDKRRVLSSSALTIVKNGVLPETPKDARVGRESVGLVRIAKFHEYVYWSRLEGHILVWVNRLNPELNPICYLLALLGAHHFLHVSRIRVKSLTLRLLMSCIYGAPILDVSRSHTTTQHSR